LRTGWDEDGLFLIALSPKFDTGHELDVARRIHELEYWVREHFEVGKLLWRWTNEDYDTQDRLPFAGELSGQNDRLYVATGFNAWGITNGTAAGLLIAEQIAGRRPAIGSVFDPCRKAQDSGHTASHIRKEQSSVAAIQAGDGAIVSTGDKKLAVYKTESGIVRALSAACTHAGCTVTWNNADKTWDCPCHGSIFSLEGRVIHGPATKDLEECAPPA
jgi:Rieske Fe-S protein